jgi:hypothetical protein
MTQPQHHTNLKIDVPDEYLELSKKFLPDFYFDYKETEKVINLNKYVTGSDFSEETIISVIINNPKGGKIIFYFLFYLQDNGKNVCGFIVDSHKYDLEYVTIEIDDNEEVKGITFAPHSTKEHFVIRNKDDLNEIFKGNTAKVYISKGKHGCYPVKNVYRLCGFGNDNCRKSIKRNLQLEMASTELLKLDRIDNLFVGISRKLILIELPEIRLNKIKFRKLLPI